MFTSVHETLIQSSVLASLPGIVHGFSLRSSGDMREIGNRDKFLRLLHLQDAPLLMPQQIHGTAVIRVTAGTTSPVPSADGLIMHTDDNHGLSPGIGVIVADCVPLLFADAKQKTVAATHAGWKGTLGEISVITVQKMVESGSNPEDICVSVGPHIGMCCYDVPEARIVQFEAKYRNDPRAMCVVGGTWHMDIGYLNVRQLLGAGIRKEHIDAVPMCTSCQIQRYYSYRVDTHETFGEIMGVIACRVV